MPIRVSNLLPYEDTRASERKHPNITVKLSGHKNDRFAIIIACLRVLRENNLAHELDNFSNDIKNGGENLLATVNKWFNVE